MSPGYRGIGGSILVFKPLSHHWECLVNRLARFGAACDNLNYRMGIQVREYVIRVIGQGTLDDLHDADCDRLYNCMQYNAQSNGR